MYKKRDYKTRALINPLEALCIVIRNTWLAIKYFKMLSGVVFFWWYKLLTQIESQQKQLRPHQPISAQLNRAMLRLVKFKGKYFLREHFCWLSMNFELNGLQNMPNHKKNTRTPVSLCDPRIHPNSFVLFVCLVFFFKFSNFNSRRAKDLPKNTQCRRKQVSAEWSHYRISTYNQKLKLHFYTIKTVLRATCITDAIDKGFI